MAIIGVNQPGAEPQKESGLDKVLKGIQIAQGLMGTALAIPRFMQEREEFKSSQNVRQAQGQKFFAEAAQTEADNAPVSSDQTNWFKAQGVPEAALPKTIGQARGLAEKLIETPAQKESRQYRDISLGLQAQTAERAGRAEVRGIEEKEQERSKREQLEFEEKYVPGAGLAYTVQDAKDIKDATELRASFDRKIDEMIDLRKKYGFEIANRAAVARGKQLSNDLLLTYKNMAKLGVLSKSDESIINAIIPNDPLGMTVPGEGADPILTTLEKFKNDVASDFSNRIKTRIKVPDEVIIGQPQMTTEDNAALQWANENPNDPRSAAIKQRLGVK